MTPMILTSFTDDGSATVDINGEEYLYLGFCSAKFKTILAKNIYKPGRTLNWLKKNATECHKMRLVYSTRKEDRSMACIDCQPKTTSGNGGFAQRKRRQQRRKEMIKAARNWFEVNRPGYLRFESEKATAIRPDVCPDCTARARSKKANAGRVAALIKYYTPDKVHLIRVCLNQWNPMKAQQCTYSDKITAPVPTVKKKEAPVEVIAPASELAGTV